ncbi:hypothetical protein DLAC_04901 [Tieghemostelium lacteum]|uniref:Golgi apparatus membrane protein TVP23 homolog n=1 Tax=Tieghemostelium lacteum TaxID=361077 RepID=A0A151ZJL5_TIELA|nr:hypothetical protein DLAC_04901 [Tieghemostelium lacteum]|eukprot:KYQ94004.1 hypothetical protein DLAC_04901 [Tieghemostelium lacteum]
MSFVNDLGFTDTNANGSANIDINDSSPFINNSGTMNNSGNINAPPNVPNYHHPIATIFHVLFKVAAILVYLFGNFIFGLGFIMTFILSILMISFDFWTTKNVTGRLLVGLRWWNQVMEDGTNVWYFETAPKTFRPHQMESLIFWMGLYINPLVWLVFFLSSLLSLNFNWLIITVIALALAFANIYGYYKCNSKDKNASHTNIARNYIGSTIVKKAASSFM